MARTISLKIPSLPKIRRSHFIVFVLLLIGMGTLLYWHDFYGIIKYDDDGQREAQNIAFSIRGKVVLPDGQPGLATVSDVSKINRGGVLADAKNGDKILLYYRAGKAILYRPSEGKVIALGPIVLDASAAQVKGSRIVVRNGSIDSTRLSDTLTLLSERYSEARNIKTEKASRSDFPKTIVVDLTDDNTKTQFVGAIAELIGGQKGILPQGESKPDADILIIVGKD